MKNKVFIGILVIIFICSILVSNAVCANQMVTDSYSFTIIEDLIAPQTISSLSVSDSTHNSVTLAWTAPGDDGSTGTATNYDLRYSTSPINDSNWSSATQVSGEPSPAVAGSAENMTINGLAAETTYYFAINATDDNSNVSGFSNIANVTTSAVPDTTPPYTVGHIPAKNATDVAKDTNIVVHVKDDGAGVDISTIIMRVEGNVVTPTITGTPADYTLTYVPSSDFDNQQLVNVEVEAQDLAN